MPSTDVTTKNDHVSCGTPSEFGEAPASDGVKSDRGNTGDTSCYDNSTGAIDLAHLAHTDLNATSGWIGMSENGKRSDAAHTFRIEVNNPAFDSFSCCADTTHSRHLNNLIGIMSMKEESKKRANHVSVNDRSTTHDLVHEVHT